MLEEQARHEWKAGIVSMVRPVFGESAEIVWCKRRLVSPGVLAAPFGAARRGPKVSAKKTAKNTGCSGSFYIRMRAMDFGWKSSGS